MNDAADAEVAGLRARLLKQATCIYIAAEPECADDVSDGLRKAVAMIDRLTATLAERTEQLANEQRQWAFMLNRAQVAENTLAERDREVADLKALVADMERGIAALRAKDEIAPLSPKIIP